MIDRVTAAATSADYFDPRSRIDVFDQFDHGFTSAAFAQINPSTIALDSVSLAQKKSLTQSVTRERSRPHLPYRASPLA